MTQSTHDDDSSLAAVDLNAWQVPPPAALDRASLLGRALSPATAPPKASPLKWILAAIVVVNAAIAMLIVQVTRVAPRTTTTTVALPAGGDTDARVLALLERVERQQRELQSKLAEIQELRTLVLDLTKRVQAFEGERTVPQRTPTPAPIVPPKQPTVERPSELDPPGKSELPALGRSAITSVMRSLEPAILACGQHSATKGTIKVHARVSPDGTVASAGVDAGTDTLLADCVANVVSHARFGRTQGGSFSYPFIIQ